MGREFFSHTLSNGLLVLGEPDRRFQSLALGFFVSTGARDEGKGEAGLSHFLEHMMFKGTPTRSALDITYSLGSMGVQSNAYTSDEMTVFYGAALAEHRAPFQEILSDMMRPLLDPDEFEVERKVILEEIALYQDRPHFCLMEGATAQYFGQHPCGHSVLGSSASITNVTREDMQRYFLRRYGADNIVLVAAGNFEWEPFLEDAERWCGAWKPCAPVRERPPFEARGPSQHVEYKRGLHQSHMVWLAPGPAARDGERIPLGVLSVILGDGSGSKLYWELVETGIAEHVSLDIDEKDGVGVSLVYACGDDARLDEISDRITSIVQHPLSFSEDDLTRAKAKMCSRMVLGGELPMGRLMAIGSDWLMRGEVEPLSETIHRVRAVTRRDIEDSLNRYPLTGWNRFLLRPQLA